MHDKKNGVLKPKPGEYLQPAWRNVVRFYKNTVKSPKKMFEQTDVSYYKNTHKTEIFYQPHLFKVNRITHEKRLINLCVLLGQNGQKVQEMNLPPNEEALTILREKDNPIEIQDTEIEVNQAYVTLWIEKNQHTWYIGHCIGNKNDGTYKIDYLYRVNRSSILEESTISRYLRRQHRKHSYSSN